MMMTDVSPTHYSLVGGVRHIQTQVIEFYLVLLLNFVLCFLLDFYYLLVFKLKFDYNQGLLFTCNF
jgi:hypothetical protein